MISGHSGRGRPEQSEVAGPVHVVKEGLRKEILQSAGECAPFLAALPGAPFQDWLNCSFQESL